MDFTSTKIAGVTLIELDVRSDERGGFARVFCEKQFAEVGHSFHVSQTNLSFNPHLHTLRGLHFQRAPYGEPKIVSCVRGRIWDVAVDVRVDSPTYGQWEAFELAADEPYALLLDKGLAHGFITLEADSIVHYYMGASYVAEAADGIKWNDPELGIAWPFQPSVISQRDAEFSLLSQVDIRG